jgi:hypothetical protein
MISGSPLRATRAQVQVGFPNAQQAKTCNGMMQ